MKRKFMLLSLIFITNIFGVKTLTEFEIRENVIVTAAQLLGTPYKSKGSSEKGFDCSGFVNFVMNIHNIKIARSSAAIINEGQEKSLEEVQPGDILVFKGANKKSSRPGHSAIVHHIDEDGIVHFIHSASSKGVTIDDLSQQYYKNRFLKARDVITPAINH